MHGGPPKAKETALVQVSWATHVPSSHSTLEAALFPRAGKPGKGLGFGRHWQGLAGTSRIILVSNTFTPFHLIDNLYSLGDHYKI